MSDPLRTTRLTLVPFAREHVAFLHRLWTDAAVRRYLWDDRVIAADEAAAVVAGSVESFAVHGFGMWVVMLEPDGEAVGFCGLRHFGAPPTDVEILYGLLPAYWGRGLATEAARAVLAAGFARGLPRVFAGADAPNTGSLRVMERLGMRNDGKRVVDGREARYYVLDANS